MLARGKLYSPRIEHTLQRELIVPTQHGSSAVQINLFYNLQMTTAHELVWHQNLMKTARSHPETGSLVLILQRLSVRV